MENGIAKYPVTSDNDDPPSINVPPGEDIVYYKILSCGEGPDEQIIPLELIVSAPVQKGDVGDGLISLTEEDLNSLSGQEGTPLKVPLNTYIGQDGTTGDIKFKQKIIQIQIFMYLKEQWNNVIIQIVLQSLVLQQLMMRVIVQSFKTNFII